MAAALNICEALGSLKFNSSSKKPSGRTSSNFVFSVKQYAQRSCTPYGYFSKAA
ncbi:hypothetical protein GCWU000324_02030 [Kingella oralis ATCC 51147]|uniref:Uncharacterized protein n=1 Tax=Kingella oralis ATCC 51147 TaxID=629741 RepID=C4GJ08_9NEIS|nr:hypothetical protein GCWU000324_02030 [Kingella oralis ATCC 51147]